MESRIVGYKLVPEINDCDGCAFENNRNCPLNKSINLDCIGFESGKNYIYVPADTAIEVPKVNQLDNEQ